MQGIETKEDTHTAFRITAEQSAELHHRYEVAEIVLNLKKALGLVGDVTISEAISELGERTDFVFLPMGLDLENVPTVGNHDPDTRLKGSRFSATYVDDSCHGHLSPQ